MVLIIFHPPTVPRRYDVRMILRDANPNHWRLGMLCFNRQDRRLFVPKRYGFGRTVTFANIWAWLLIAVTVLVLIASLLNRGMRRRA